MNTKTNIQLVAQGRPGAVGLFWFDLSFAAAPVGLARALEPQKMKKEILIIVLSILFPLSTYAVVFGGSNLGYVGYPSHDCIKPTKPIKPYSLNSQWEIDSYNSQVDLYNSQLRQYLSCIDEYIEKANNDIKRINEKVQEAIDEVNYLP